MTGFTDHLAELGVSIAGKALTPRITYRCRCPRPSCAGKRGEALALTVDGDGLGAVFICHRCGWSGSVRGDHARDWAGTRPVAAAAARPGEPDRRRAFLRKILAESRPIGGTLAKVYLFHRGLDPSLTTALRYHPALWHQESRRNWPAMIALIQDVDGTVTGMHRTWLARDGTGKAPVEPVRKSFALADGATKGCAVRLAGVVDALVIGEGIETTLAAMEMQGLPGWAAIYAGNLPLVRLPAGLRRAVIMADHDENGIGLRQADAAASLLSRRGLNVEVLVPRAPGDANDVWRRRSAHPHATGAQR